MAALRIAKITLLIAILVATIGCPLPFQFTVDGWSGNSGTADPSTPDITATPTLSYSSSGGSGVLQSGGTATTTADMQITFQSDTLGSAIFYTTDGSNPSPGASSTSRYSASSPVSVAIANPSPTDSSVSEIIKAIAIGPNRKPSTVMTATLTVQYPQATAPTFSPGAGFFASDQTVILSSATAGSTIYYTIVSGAGPAARPQPGQAGTVQYPGGISVAGAGNTWSISAISVHEQMMDSVTASGTYMIEGLSSFSSWTQPEIAAARPQMTAATINNSDGNRIVVGQIFLYITSSGNYGKMVVLNNNADGNYGLQFKFVTYNSDGTVLASSNGALCNGTWSFDLDMAPAGTEDHTAAGFVGDFWAENQTGAARDFAPQNGALFSFGGIDPAP